MHQKEERDILSLSKLQSDLLDTAWDLLKEDGTYILYLFFRKRRRRKSNRKFHKRKNSLLDEINTSEIDKRLNISDQNKWLESFQIV